MTKESITIKATVQANITKAWDYYTNPNHITNWNFAHESWHCPAASNDLTIGGKYLARMEARDGSMGFDFEAIYDEIVEHKKIVYTLTDERKVVIDFLENGNQTEITVEFEAENQNPIAMQQAGWQAILNNYKDYTEKH